MWLNSQLRRGVGYRHLTTSLEDSFTPTVSCCVCVIVGIRELLISIQPLTLYGHKYRPFVCNLKVSNLKLFI